MRRVLGQACEQRVDSFGQPAHDRVGEARLRARAVPRGRARPSRSPPRAAERPCSRADTRRAVAQRGRVDRACAPDASRASRSRDRACAPVARSRRRAAARARGRGCRGLRGAAENAVRVRLVLEHTQDDLVRRLYARSSKSAQELVVRHAPLAVRLHLERLEPSTPTRAFQIVTRPAIATPRVRRCAATARGCG